MKAKKEQFHGWVGDLKEGDRFQKENKFGQRRFWIVGAILKPFDMFTVRITVTPEEDIIGEEGNELLNGEYTQMTFGKEVIL